MKHTEYIIPIGEEAKEFDEIFIGVIRKQKELIRCKDCIKKEICSIFRIAKQELGFCAWAARREE